jgi:hypothetical protein
MKQVEIKKDVTKITNGEVLARYRALLNINGVKGTKLLYAIHRNKQILKPYAEAFDDKELIPISEALIKHNDAVSAIYKKYADDGKGGFKLKTIMDNGTPVQAYDIDINDPKIKKEVDALAKKNNAEKLIEERNKDIKDYNEFLLAPCEEQIKTFYIPVSLAPDDQIAFNAVSFMLADFTPEQEAQFNELFNSVIKHDS